MKTFLTMLGGMLLMCGCSSDNDSDALPQTQHIYFKAQIGMPATRALSENGDNEVKAKWEIGENVALVYQVGAKTVVTTANVTEVDAKEQATIKAELNKDVNDDTPVDIIFPASAVNSDGTVKTDLLDLQDGTLATLSKNLDLRKGSGTLKVEQSAASLKASVTLAPQYAVYQLTMDVKARELVVFDGNKHQMVTTVTPSQETSTVWLAMLPEDNRKLSFYVTDDNGKGHQASGTLDTTPGDYRKMAIPLKPIALPADLEAIDLGLPSGTKWANINVPGDFYAWGETTGYGADHTFNKANYIFMDENQKLTKYCNYSNYGVLDNKTQLELVDDPAFRHWGGNWHTPTYEDFQELRQYTTVTAIGENMTTGYLFASKNNANTITLPAKGYIDGNSAEGSGTAQYWTATHWDAYNEYPTYSYYVEMPNLMGLTFKLSERYQGRLVRAVTK